MLRQRRLLLLLVVFTINTIIFGRCKLFVSSLNNDLLFLSLLGNFLLFLRPFANIIVISQSVDVEIQLPKYRSLLHSLVHLLA